MTDGAAAVLGDLRDRLVDLLLGTRRDDDLGAGPGERLRHRATEPATASRHDGAATVQP